MTYEPNLEKVIADYDPDRDIEETGGMGGILLADAMLSATQANPKFFEYWETIANIALPRFPELQPGEHINRREIERRLRDLKKANFPVKQNYRKMSCREMFAYLVHEIRPQIYRMAEEHCPELMEEIKQRNTKLEERAYLIR